MMQRIRTNTAFTLVELVIVVVIIGIIAAIAVPRISRGAKGADEAALRANLAALRGAIDLYAAEHGGDFPGAKLAGAASAVVAFESQLGKYTDVNGNYSADKIGKFIYGPYIRRIMPPLPVGMNRGNTKTSVGNTGPTVNVAGDFGWIYNFTIGEIIANADDLEDAGVLTYDLW